MSEENWFFRLSAFEDRLLEWYESNPTAVRPETKRNEALSFIRGGLRDISITRAKLTWGIEVPWDTSQVFYVWYDALINYLTAVGYGEDHAEVAKWWPAVHHLLGKEIMRFHCVWWPAMCMAAGIDPARARPGPRLAAGRAAKSWASRWRRTPTPRCGSPTSRPSALCEEFGVDAVRYHLLREVPLGSDGEFSLEAMQSRYNSDLANNLGNLVSRVATVVGSKCAGVGPAPGPPLGARAPRPPRRSTGRPRAGRASRRTTRSRRPGGSSGPPTPHSRTPSPGRPSPVRRSTASSATRSRCCGSWPCCSCPRCPRPRARCGGASGLRGDPADERLPDAAAWGGYPGGLTVTKGDPLFPRRRD